MTKKELGAAILKELDVLPAYINDYVEKSLITRSEEPYGFAYHLAGKDLREVEQMEAEGRTVYAVIQGLYRDNYGDSIKMTTYLFVSEDDIKTAERNILAGRKLLDDILIPHNERYGYIARARVIGPFDESGSVCIKGLNGGITRTV